MTIRADKTWVYVADPNRLVAAQLSGTQADGTNIPVATEIFHFRVSDGSVNSLETRLVIEVRGKRDKPVLQVSVDSADPFTLPNANTIDVYKKLSAVEQATTSNVATDSTGTVPVTENTAGDGFDKTAPETNYADTALVTGRWSATDPDSHARLKIEVGTTAKFLTTTDRADAGTSFGGTKLSGVKNAGTSVTFEGKFGTLTLHMDGTWEYDLDTNVNGTGRGDKIAHGEVATEIFSLKITDGWGDGSNVVNLRIAIMGRNDTPDEVNSTGGVEGHNALAWVAQSDGSVRFTMGTETTSDDIVITKDGVLQMRDGDVNYRLDGTLDLVQGIAPDNVQNASGVITVTNPAGTGTPFKIVRSETGEVKLVTTLATSGNPAVEREFVIRTDDAGDPATIGILYEGADRYTGESTHPGDRTANERAGVSIARGTLDGIDPDAIGVDGQESALDDHHFRIKQYNGDGGSTAVANGAVTAGAPMTLADAAWAVFQLKTKAAWDAVAVDAGVKQAYTTAFTAATESDEKTALGTAFTALGTATAGADYTTKLAAFYTALKGLGATMEVTGKFGTLTLNKYSGQWEYVLDNADLDTQELDGAVPGRDNNLGQSGKADVVYDVFTIIVTDEEGASVEKQVRVRITGENDAPVLFGRADAAVGQTGDWTGVTRTAKEKGTVRKVDPDDNVEKNTDEPATNASGRLGVFDIDQDARQDSAGRTFLAADVNGGDERTATAREVTAGHFSFEAANRVAPATFDDADTDVNSTRDSNGAVDEDAATIANNALTWVSTDEDGGNDDGSVRILGKFGLLNIAADGSWTYHLFGEHATTASGPRNGITDDMVTRVEKLGDGERRQEHFAIRVKDGSGTESNIIHLSLDVTGTNDKAEVAINTHLDDDVTEAGSSPGGEPAAGVGSRAERRRAGGRVRHQAPSARTVSSSRPISTLSTRRPIWV